MLGQIKCRVCGTKIILNRYEKCKPCRLVKCPFPKCDRKIEPTARSCHKHRQWRGE
jgi:hypothetical protein